MLDAAQALNYLGANNFVINLKNKGEMLDYSKNLLNKVSFDKILFKKELKKAIKWINKDERVVLQVWCLATFGHVYKDVISESFQSIM